MPHKFARDVSRICVLASQERLPGTSYIDEPNNANRVPITPLNELRLSLKQHLKSYHLNSVFQPVLSRFGCFGRERGNEPTCILLQGFLIEAETVKRTSFAVITLVKVILEHDNEVSSELIGAGTNSNMRTIDA